jgi:NADH:ubiquinone oxidoreductase subunit 2 (subunit N)
VGLNFLTSAIGSLLYLLGSIYFIPATNNIELGEILFIAGSAVIVLSQAWKCFRTCVTPPERRVSDNINSDLMGFLVDVFAGLGGLLYLIGTVIFMKSKTIEDREYLAAVILFTLGGLAFLASGLFMQKRYFCGKNTGYVPFGLNN